MIGNFFSNGWKNRADFSNDWKLFFQWLENFLRAAGGPVVQGGGHVSEPSSRTSRNSGMRR